MRPFAGFAEDATGFRRLAYRAVAQRADLDTDTAAQDSDGTDGEALEALAAILSGAATEAQCRAFREAAAVSAALRAEAQSALVFVGAVHAEAAQPAPAHLIQEVLPAQGGSSGVICRHRAGAGARAMPSAAAVAVVLLGGLGVPLLWQSTTGET